MHGDRTLSAYRQAMAQHAGLSCSTGIVSAGDETSSSYQRLADVFERVQLILRLSGRLRKLHGD